jgi:hypothetical protein
MSEKQNNHSDQADTLRKRIEQHKESQESGEHSEKLCTGTLPPRSTVHTKPPLRLTPFYIAGVLLIFVLTGLVFWWYTARSEQTTTQSQASSQAEKPAAKTEEHSSKATSSKPETTSTVPVPKGQTKQPQIASQPQTKSVQPPTNVAAASANSGNGKPAVPRTQLQPAPEKPTAAVKPIAAVKPTVKQPQTEKAAVAKKQKRIIRHRMQPGETLYKISVRYYRTGKYQFYLARYNGIRNINNVYVGSIVKVPIPPY